MKKYLKIIIVLLSFSIITSILICCLLEWNLFDDMPALLIYILIPIYVGAFAAIFLVYKKFRELSSKDIGLRFFAILLTFSLGIFAGISYFIGSTINIRFEPGVTHEQAQRIYFERGIIHLMPIKMFVGTFTGMILAVRAANRKLGK